MSEVVLTRIDFRLIHGQVITKWLKISGANKIIVIDDALSNDDFMKEIYVMSAPPGVPVEIYSEQDAISIWKEDKFGEGKVLILFKDVDSVYSTIKGGVELSDIQIGGLGSGPNKKKIYGPISMDENDYIKLKELYDEGTKVVLHQVPEENALNFEKVIRKVEEEKLWI